MKKLSKAANVIDKCAVVIMIIVLVAATIGAAAFGVIALAPESSLTFKTAESVDSSLELGDFCFTVAPGYEYSLNVSKGFYIAIIASLVLTVVVFVIGVKVFRKVLAPMKKGRPFDESVGDNLIKLGWIEIIGGVAVEAMRISASMFMYKIYDMDNLFIGKNITECRFNIAPDILGALIAGAAFFLLGFIFKYGASLQQQADETL